MNVSKMLTKLFAKGVDHKDPYVYLSNQVGHRSLGFELFWWIGMVSVLISQSQSYLKWVALLLVIGYLIFEFVVQRQDKSNNDYIADCLLDTLFVSSGVLMGWILIAAIVPDNFSSYGFSIMFPFVSISFIVALTNAVIWKKVYDIMWKSGVLSQDLRSKGAEQTRRVIEGSDNERQRMADILDATEESK